MYNKIISLIYIIVLMNLLILPFVFAQDDRAVDLIEKIMQTAKKDIAEDINRNMDDNFQQLDERLIEKNKALFRKAIFSLAGALSVVMFGFAYVHNRVSRKYDINFYEKMIESKISSSQGYLNISSKMYESVTKPSFQDRYETPEQYFERVSDSETVKKLKEKVGFLKQKLGEKKAKEPLYETIKTEKKEEDVKKSWREQVPPKVKGKKPSKFKQFISFLKADKLQKKDKLQKLDKKDNLDKLHNQDELDKKINKKKKLIFVLVIVLCLVILFVYLKYQTSIIDNLINIVMNNTGGV